VRSIRLHLTIPDHQATVVSATLAGYYGRPGLLCHLDGDAALLEGSWSCVPDGNDTAVTFSARLDMGSPSQADTLEPRAALTLVDDTVAIVSGLFGDGARIDDIVMQARQPSPV
jgi:hypothetical protein